MEQKLLLVEDDDAIRFIYDRQLNLAGFMVESVATGTEGLSAIETRNYDIILLDIMLPGINGIDILRKLRKNNKMEQLSIVLLTNLAQDEIIKEAFSLGILGYLIKAQLTPDQLVVEVKNFIKNKGINAKFPLVINEKPDSSV